MCVYVVMRDDGTSLMLLGNYKKKMFMLDCVTDASTTMESQNV